MASGDSPLHARWRPFPLLHAHRPRPPAAPCSLAAAASPRFFMLVDDGCLPCFSTLADGGQLPTASCSRDGELPAAPSTCGGGSLPRCSQLTFRRWPPCCSQLACVRQDGGDLPQVTCGVERRRPLPGCVWRRASGDLP
jgi:hypothetical protein